MLAPPQLLCSFFRGSRCRCFNPTQDACSSATLSGITASSVYLRGFNPTQDACSSATGCYRSTTFIVGCFNPTQDACSSATLSTFIMLLPVQCFNPTQDA